MLLNSTKSLQCRLGYQGSWRITVLSIKYPGSLFKPKVLAGCLFGLDAYSNLGSCEKCFYTSVLFGQLDACRKKYFHFDSKLSGSENAECKITECVEWSAKSTECFIVDECKCF